MTKCRICDHRIPVGTYLCSNCGAPVDTATPQATDDLEQQVRSLLGDGKKLEAVKLYKERTDVSLLEAKNAVEAIEGGDLPPKPPVPDDEMEAELLRLLKAGEKIEACKLYRNRMGVQLFEAKQAVEALAARHGIASKGGGGCAGVLLAIVVAAVLLLCEML